MAIILEGPLHGVAAIQASVRETWNHYFALQQVWEENQRLKQEIQQLQGEQNRLREQAILAREFQILSMYQKTAPLTSIPARIIGRHLLPGFMSHLIASATLSVPAMILGETALSFLGLGLRPPVTSWGVLLNEAQNINVVALYPWLLFPVVPVVLVILTFNFFGDGLRDAADPYK